MTGISHHRVKNIRHTLEFEYTDTCYENCIERYSVRHKSHVRVRNLFGIGWKLSCLKPRAS